MDQTRPQEAPQGTRGPDANLAPGLYFVATPIGSARDITLRALDILREADVIVAEDTRSLRRLMEIHAIPLAGRPLLAYHDHNGARMRPRLARELDAGKRVVYASEAGTPLVADPGYQLARLAIERETPVWSAPGPSAVLAALTVAGLPTDRFLFAGFPPPQTGARRRWISALEDAHATVVLYESPKRVHRLLEELCEILGEDRKAALCRELTKRFEEVRRGTLGGLLAGVVDDPPRGEIVIVVDRSGGVAASAADVEAELRTAMNTKRVKDAAREVADRLGLSRRDVYQTALNLKAEDEHGT